VRFEPRYPQLSVDVPAEQAEHAVIVLFELGAEGVEERDESTLASGSAPGMTTLVASFAERALAEQAAGALEDSWSPRVAEIVGDAWRDEWKKHFAPFRLTATVTIVPPWQVYSPSEPSEIVLELEPGRAFGTGLHPTTALVAREMEVLAHEWAGGAVLDVGTGSGILALVSVKLGAARARAIDIDPDAVATTLENARRNGLDRRIEADGCPLASVTGVYHLVVANIEAAVLVEMAPHLQERMGDGGFLILSGILVEQREAVKRAFAELELAREPVDGEWTALVFRSR
jgi:ribosomal protein L11 methyltransferase